MQMMSVLTNPDSVNLGKKHEFSMYKLFDKIIRIYQTRAEQKKCNIILRGDCFKDIRAYRVASLLPSIFIDNAVKYSCRNQQIIIEINEERNKVVINITSNGPVIDETEKAKIFERSYRGRAAKKFSEQGGGFGLHIAKMICEKNNIDLKFKSTLLNHSIDGFPVAQNTFTISI